MIPESTPTPDADPDFELLTRDETDRWNAARQLPIARSMRNRRLALWVRSLLVLMACGFAFVFGIAIWLNPYDDDGNPRSMATHTQLGLPPCNMVTLIGKPCPACGMTTSFALLMKGDVWNSMKANWVGTMLASFGLILIPWACISAVRGKYLFIRSAESASTVVVIVLLVLMFVRWGIVLLQ